MNSRADRSIQDLFYIYLNMYVGAWFCHFSVCAQLHVDWDVQTKRTWIRTHLIFFVLQFLDFIVRHVSVGNPLKSVREAPGAPS